MRISQVPSNLSDRGACREGGGPDFFSQNIEEIQQAKILCAGCPVKFECIQWAVSVPETYGVWGGADQWEIRLACGVGPHGEPAKKATRAKCPFCRSVRFVSETRDLASRSSFAHCSQCGLEWRRAKSFVKKERTRRRASPADEAAA